jgi:hypothetical protein
VGGAHLSKRRDHGVLLSQPTRWKLQGRVGPSGRAYDFCRAVSGEAGSRSCFLSVAGSRSGPACVGACVCPGPRSSMGGARAAGWVAAGLVLGAGACYCIYRLTRGQRRGGHGRRLRPSRSAGEAVGAAWHVDREGTQRPPWARCGRRRHKAPVSSLSWQYNRLNWRRDGNPGGQGGASLDLCGIRTPSMLPLC